MPVIGAGLIRSRLATIVAAAARARRLGELGQAEVQHLHRAVVAHLDVGRLEIAVNDAALVRGFQRLGNLSRDRQGFIDRDRALCDAIRERHPLDQLHHQRLHAVRLLEAVDGGDVRMIERGEHLGLPLKSPEPLRIGREHRRQHLDRDLTLQPGVRRAIHLAHSADTEWRDDGVRAEEHTA